MDIDTLAGIAAIAAAILAGFAMQSRKFAELKTDYRNLDAKVTSTADSLRSDMKNEIQKLQNEIATTSQDIRTEMRSGFKAIENRLNVLEQRTYDISQRHTA